MPVGSTCGTNVRAWYRLQIEHVELVCVAPGHEVWLVSFHLLCARMCFGGLKTASLQQNHMTPKDEQIAQKLDVFSRDDK